MYVYMFSGICLCLCNVCMCICSLMYVYDCVMHVCMCICSLVHVYGCVMHECMCVYMFSSVCFWSQRSMHMSIHICKNTYIHMYAKEKISHLSCLDMHLIHKYA
jgi:hypothetical protein